jgi:hypothetical protein
MALQLSDFYFYVIMLVIHIKVSFCYEYVLLLLWV